MHAAFMFQQVLKRVLFEMSKNNFIEEIKHHAAASKHIARVGLVSMSL